ncbi:FhuE receptor [Frankliniella fusca]|uniref:FhuE receptor n=1 Tax=Frankliniella fusca TaxID=407009 RepID=A0AAE1HAM1_9NEOP|nr:FhuE receptor [Frankliniella fusca]
MAYLKVASTGYAIIAQPLQAGASSFCLSLFGTNNCFTSENVYKRWAFISQELLKIGIKVECFASDGDHKLLGAMHSLMFGKNFSKLDWKDWFFASSSSHEYTVIQDALHTANKFRNNLSPSKLFPTGNFTASQAHLRILIKTVSKESHGL